jgi:hypothetical protein
VRGLAAISSFQLTMNWSRISCLVLAILGHTFSHFDDLFRSPKSARTVRTAHQAGSGRGAAPGSRHAGASRKREMRTASRPRRMVRCENVSSEVDITLIQETLALTPQQRIQQNDRVLHMIEELRDGLAKSRKPAEDTGVQRR